MEDLLVLDSNFNSLEVIDVYESCIWNERYTECGDFEIHTPMNMAIYDLLQEDRFVSIPDSNNLMIIESRSIQKSIELGNYLLVKGRTLESLLWRRIIWNQEVFTDASIQTVIQTLMNNNAINPSNTDRVLHPALSMVLSTDPAILAMTINYQAQGEFLYTAIQKMCSERKLGFKINLTSTNELEFSLYLGQNRAYDQTINSYVVFSDKFDNLLSSSYTIDKKPLRNVSLVLGAGEGTARKSTTSGTGVGLERREMFTDAGNLSEENDGVPILEADYLAQLEQKGNESLAQNKMIEEFDTEVVFDGVFVYGVDYDIGDLVQTEDEYGNSGKSRVSEITFSKSPGETSMHPIFKKED